VLGTDAPGELGDLAREFNHMSKQLGELDRLKDQFLHTVSHDLRNPLSAVITSVRLLRNDRLPPEFGPLINIIEASVVRLQTMASNLLDTARLREGGLTFQFQWVEVPPLVAELTRLYQALADKAGKTIVVDVPPDLPRLWADEEKVMRIFLNLVSNAFKFTRTRDRITLMARAVPGAVEFPGERYGVGDPSGSKRPIV
jgi:signal transduction histidine kinase